MVDAREAAMVIMLELERLTNTTWAIDRQTQDFDGKLPWVATIRRESDGFAVQVSSSTKYGKRYGLRTAMAHQRDARGDFHYVPFDVSLPSCDHTLTDKVTAKTIAKRIIKKVIERGQQMHNDWQRVRDDQVRNINRAECLHKQLADVGVIMQESVNNYGLKAQARLLDGKVYVNTRQGSDGAEMTINGLTAKQVAQILELLK